MNEEMENFNRTSMYMILLIYVVVRVFDEWKSGGFQNALLDCQIFVFFSFAGVACLRVSNLRVVFCLVAEKMAEMEAEFCILYFLLFWLLKNAKFNYGKQSCYGLFLFSIHSLYNFLFLLRLSSRGEFWFSYSINYIWV